MNETLRPTYGGLRITPYRRAVLERIANGGRPFQHELRQAGEMAKAGLVTYTSHSCKECGRWTHTTWALTELGQTALKETV